MRIVYRQHHFLRWFFIRASGANDDVTVSNATDKNNVPNRQPVFFCESLDALGYYIPSIQP
jgi:hypothetical protein